jgi:hypothetical protein
VNATGWWREPEGLGTVVQCLPASVDGAGRDTVRIFAGDVGPTRQRVTAPNPRPGSGAAAVTDSGRSE